MAGPHFSRYVLSVWSALFAPFNFLFARIWRLFAQATGNRDIATVSSPKPALPPSPTSPTTPTTPSSTPTSPAPVASDAATTKTATTLTADDSASATPVSPPGLHDLSPSHSIVGADLPDHTTPSDCDGKNGDDSDTQLDHATSLFSQGHRQNESADMARKRSGRGRGGAKSSIHQVTAVTPVTPASPAADAVNSWSASASQSDSNVSGDTSFAPSHPNGPVFLSPKRGGSRVRNHNSAMAQQEPVDNRKENIAPQKHDGTVSRVARSISRAQAPLVVTDNTREPQGSGTRRDAAVESASTTPTITSTCDESSTSCSEAEQLHVVANRLTLNETSFSEQPAQQTLHDATAAAEASALPVPLVVAVPIPSQSQAAQPNAQPPPSLPGLIEPTTDEERAEREYHLTFMREALDMGDLALKTNETPVGCVLVYRGRIIARGMNATNVTRNGTRHAEFMALSALLSRRGSSDIMLSGTDIDLDDASWGDVDPQDGHIYPYGQKLHPAPVVDRSIISECVLYVTVEPCVMCASLLRQLGIKKVYFGAVNDKFGGTGGVFRVHMNSKPVAIPEDRPYQLGYGPHDVRLISKGRAMAMPRDEDEGDGGNVEPGYPVEGGYLRDDAVSLLRRFYVQENGRAPQPRKKEGRAARLFAAMENQNRTNTSDLSDNTPETPVEAEAPMALGGKLESEISVVCA
ncbi:hypothetical protein F5Y03DRAFT_229798 [Xylaria venustula]|nr:hypothetical protein F5Y03DRAFT_229798 [Xylaria venustula]